MASAGQIPPGIGTLESKFAPLFPARSFVLAPRFFVGGRNNGLVLGGYHRVGNPQLRVDGRSAGSLIAELNAQPRMKKTLCGALEAVKS